MDPLFMGVTLAFLYIFITHILSISFLHAFTYQTIKKINSFALGITTAYLIIILIPETLITVNGELTKHYTIAPIIMLLTFSFQFIIHRIIAKNVKRDVEERALHLITATVYHFFLGILFLVFSTYLNYFQTAMFFIPIFIHGAFSHLTRHNKNLLKKSVENRKLIKELKFFNHGAIILGVFVGSLFQANFFNIAFLIAIVAGNYIYSIFMENMINKNVIRNRWLLAGQIFYITIYLVTRLFGF